MNLDMNEEEVDAETVRRLLGGPAEGMVLGDTVGRIAARGRSRRQRRHVLSAAAGTAGVAGALALALVLPAATAPQATASKITSLNVDLSAFSVKTAPSDPSIAITLKQLGDETLLEHYLKEVGIDADLHELSMADDQSLHCVSTGGQSALPLGAVMGPGTGNLGFSTFEIPKSYVSDDPHVQIFIGRRPGGAINVVLAHKGLTCAVADGRNAAVRLVEK